MKKKMILLLLLVTAAAGTAYGEVILNNNNNYSNAKLSSKEKEDSQLLAANTVKVLPCPSSPKNIYYDGYTHTSGVTCPSGSYATGSTSGKDVHQYNVTCVPYSGYKFANGSCNVKWNIVNGAKKGTITYHSNIPGNDKTVTRVYDKSTTIYTSLIENNWKRDGYVLAGWSPVKTETNPTWPLYVEFPVDYLVKTGENWASDLYAIWKPVNKTYGNVVFIGDSYVNSSEWPQKTAEALGLNGSYTVMHRPGTGFVTSVPGVGELGGGSYVNFSSLVHYADMAISDNNQVKAVVIAGGYNDYAYNKQTIKNAIIATAKATHDRFPKATIYIAMVGTDFASLDIETKLLTTTDEAYREAANSLSYVKYIPYTNTDVSISNYLRWFGDYNGNKIHGCQVNNITSSCYYRIEENGRVNIHPTPTSGKIIGDTIANYLKKNR